MAQLVNEYQMIENKLAKHDYEQRMAKLTLDQLPINEEDKCYRSLGRAFISTPLTEIKERLQRIIDVKELDPTLSLKERKNQLEREIIEKSKV